MRALFIILSVLPLVSADKALLTPPSACRVQCLNGGICAYYIDNPSQHTCICLLDMFTGDRCQYPVYHTTSTQEVIKTVSEPKNDDYLTKDAGTKDAEEEYIEEGWDSFEKDYSEDVRQQYPEDQHDKLQPSADLKATAYTVSDSRLQQLGDEGPSNDAAYPEHGINVEAGQLYDEQGDEQLTMHEGDFEGEDEDGTSDSRNTKSVHFDDDSADLSSEKVQSGTGQSKAMRNSYDYDRERHRYQEVTQGTMASAKSLERSQELIPEAEAEDEGWMMSKRRRVVSAGISNSSMNRFAIFLLVLSVLRHLQ